MENALKILPLNKIIIKVKCSLIHNDNIFNPKEWFHLSYAIPCTNMITYNNNNNNELKMWERKKKEEEEEPLGIQPEVSHSPWQAVWS